jgi:murein DD-endopeptidase MepM/ murein hydrolase activator NlpD
MRAPVYRYNSDTCRYERATPSALTIFFYGAALLICSTFMLAGMLIVHNRFVESKKEKILRKENIALEKSEKVISRKIQEIEVMLASLHEEDKALHNKFFSSVENIQESPNDRNKNQNILLADAPSSLAFLAQVEKGSRNLLIQARESSADFARSFATRKFASTGSLPLALPVRHLTSAAIFSGYGVRINPFHKGLYQHPGIDIAVPRGTEVCATGGGRVIAVKLSSLQAGYGNYLEVDHGDGYITRYAHLENILVSKGQKVTRGSVVGTTGISGGSVAPHLHYEILRHGKNVDPVMFMVQGIGPQDYQLFMQASQKQNQSLD